MTPSNVKRLAVALSVVVVVVVLASFAAWGWGRSIMGEIDVALADGRTEMLLEARDAALVNTNVTAVADSLRWIGRFYRPPEPPDSGIEFHRYRLMERIRVCYQRDIVLHLQQLTGDPLGDDPKLWVQKYARPE